MYVCQLRVFVVFNWLDMYVCMYVCMHVCMYVRVCIFLFPTITPLSLLQSMKSAMPQRHAVCSRTAKTCIISLTSRHGHVPILNVEACMYCYLIYYRIYSQLEWMKVLKIRMNALMFEHVCMYGIALIYSNVV